VYKRQVQCQKPSGVFYTPVYTESVADNQSIRFYLYKVFHLRGGWGEEGFGGLVLPYTSFNYLEVQDGGSAVDNPAKLRRYSALLANCS